MSPTLTMDIRGNVDVPATSLSLLTDDATLLLEDTMTAPWMCTLLVPAYTTCPVRISLTVRVTVYVPGSAYVCVGDVSRLRLRSPKSHSYSSSLPVVRSGFNVARKLTVFSLPSMTMAVPDDGRSPPISVATGAGANATASDVLSLLPVDPSVTVSHTVRFVCFGSMRMCNGDPVFSENVPWLSRSFSVFPSPLVSMELSRSSE